jgi:hypothetical protein
MSPRQAEFLNLRCLPARLNVEEAAWYLGFSPTDIPILVAKNLLKPLGDPAPNGVRYFARPDLDQLISDAKWLDKASAALIKHWHERNKKARRSAKTTSTRRPTLSPPPAPTSLAV